MVGVITNPGLNPYQSYLEWSGGSPTAQQDYQKGMDLGYEWGGAGWNYKGGGTMQTEAMKKGAAAAGDSRWGAGGAPMSGGASLSPATSAGVGGVSGGGSSLSSWYGKGGAPGIDAAKAAWRADMADMRKQEFMSQDDYLLRSGVWSSGAGQDLHGDLAKRLAVEEARGLEGLERDYMNSERSWQLEQERAKRDAMRGGSQRFEGGSTGGSTNQQMMDYYSSKKQGGGGGGGAPMDGGYEDMRMAGAPKAQPMTRREASSAYYKEYGAWPTPQELDNYQKYGQAYPPG